MGAPLFQVDAFTDRPFSGNPAAVCILDGPADDGWMQHVAAEMNLSETAFVSKHEEGFDLRWFTPRVEVALCGHATLATAHVLWSEGLLNPERQARFHTRSGLLIASRTGQWIELDFPADPVAPAQTPQGLAEALGAAPRFIGATRLYYLVEVDSDLLDCLQV